MVKYLLIISLFSTASPLAMAKRTAQQKCQLSSASHFLEKTNEDVIPPEVFNCNDKGERYEGQGRRICLRQFLCARTRGGLCHNSDFLQGSTLVLGENGEVRDMLKIDLKDVFQSENSKSSKALNKMCLDKKLFQVKDYYFDCLCAKQGCGKGADTNIDLFSAIVLRSSDGDRFYKDIWEKDTIALTSLTNSIKVEYRYLTTDQRQRILDIFNYSKTADAEYCKTDVVAKEGLVARLIGSTEKVTNCAKFKEPIALGDFAATPSVVDGKNGSSAKVTTAFVAGALEKARDYLKCRPQWDEPRNYKQLTEEYEKTAPVRQRKSDR